MGLCPNSTLYNTHHKALYKPLVNNDLQLYFQRFGTALMT